MQTFSISKREYKNLQEFELSKVVTNTEGKIYNYQKEHKEKIIKILYQLSQDNIANKLYTLEMLELWQTYLPSSFCIPEGLITYRNNIIGFLLDKCNGVNLADFLNNKNIDCSSKIFYLKKIGEILESLNNMRQYTDATSFYLNDLHPGNFIVNPNDKSLNVVDLDSCKIGENRPFHAKYLTSLSLCRYIPQKYKSNGNEFFNLEGDFIVNEETDMYCYVISILNYMYGGNVQRFSLAEFYEYLNYLEWIGVSKDLIQVFSKIVSLGKNENPAELLDSLKEVQIYRANNKIYKLKKI